MTGQYFSQSRNIELSSLEYIEAQINNGWSGITTVKTFKEAYDTSVPVPIVCVRLATTNNARLELGATTLENRYLLIIDIFSRSDGQRVDLSDYIVDKLRLGYTYNTYAHASGDKSTIEATPAGRVFVTDWIGNTKIDFGEEGDPKDRYRHTISVLVRKSSGLSSSSSSFSSSSSSSS